MLGGEGDVGTDWSIGLGTGTWGLVGSRGSLGSGKDWGSGDCRIKKNRGRVIARR
jgi:hypothetical protein